MSATRTEMVASGAYTASGVSAAFHIPTAAHLMVGVDITAVSSLTRFDAWLQASDDGGTTWYDYPADLTLNSSATTTTGTISAAPGQRAIVLNHTGTTLQAVGVFKNIAADTVRLKWILTATSVTFSASMVAK